MNGRLLKVSNFLKHFIHKQGHHTDNTQRTPPSEYLPVMSFNLLKRTAAVHPPPRQLGEENAWRLSGLSWHSF